MTPARDWTYRPGELVRDAGAVRVRRFAPEDRAVVRKICADTGFLGKPVDPLFEDRELFADYLTGYYTDHEPESTFIVEKGGAVAGYLMGCRFPQRQRRVEPLRLIALGLRGGLRLASLRYNRATRAYIWWILRKGRSETPPSPAGYAHFHVNLLEQAKSIAGSRALFESFLFYLRDTGVTGVYGQMSAFDGKRAAALFERYGFRVLNQREVTKYRALHPEPVTLFTVARTLADFDGLGS